MILIVSSTKNTNYQLANTLASLGSELGIQSEVISLEDFTLPLYTPCEEDKETPQNAIVLTEKFTKAKGLVILAPEYNGSLPPILNNAVAWVSRSGNEDWRAAFNGKPVVVGTRSGGGGIKVCQAMRTMFEHLGSLVLPRHIVTSSQRSLNEDSGKAILTQLQKLSEALS